MRSGGRRARRIALIPIDIKWHDSFLYGSPKNEIDRVVFHVKPYRKGMILLFTITNIEI